MLKEHLIPTVIQKVHLSESPMISLLKEDSAWHMLQHISNVTYINTYYTGKRYSRSLYFDTDIARARLASISFSCSFKWQ